MYADTEYLERIIPADILNSVGDADKWAELLALAEIKIDELTFNRIKGVGFNRLTPFQQDCIRKATCYQAQYIGENGYDESEIASYSVGDISLSVSGETSQSQRLSVNPVAYSLLKQSGLMTRMC